MNEASTCKPAVALTTADSHSCCTFAVHLCGPTQIPTLTQPPPPPSPLQALRSPGRRRGGGGRTLWVTRRLPCRRGNVPLRRPTVSTDRLSGSQGSGSAIRPDRSHFFAPFRRSPATQPDRPASGARLPGDGTVARMLALGKPPRPSPRHGSAQSSGLPSSGAGDVQDDGSDAGVSPCSLQGGGGGMALLHRSPKPRYKFRYDYSNTHTHTHTHKPETSLRERAQKVQHRLFQ